MYFFGIIRTPNLREICIHSLAPGLRLGTLTGPTGFSSSTSLGIFATAALTNALISTLSRALGLVELGGGTGGLVIGETSLVGIVVSFACDGDKDNCFDAIKIESFAESGSCSESDVDGDCSFLSIGGFDAGPLTCFGDGMVVVDAFSFRGSIIPNFTSSFTGIAGSAGDRLSGDCFNVVGGSMTLVRTGSSERAPEEASSSSFNFSVVSSWRSVSVGSFGSTDCSSSLSGISFLVFVAFLGSLSSRLSRLALLWRSVGLSASTFLTVRRCCSPSSRSS